MIALFDSGNSYLHFGLWDGTTIRDTQSIPYPGEKHLLQGSVCNLIDTHKPDNAVACSVNSRWREPLFKTIDSCMSDGFFVARYASDIGLSVSYDDPDTYGIDRALAAYAAFNHFRDSCVVIDAGTAISVDAVDSDGKVRGGYIFPGRKSLIHSLSLRTDLPDVDSNDNESGIGTNTEACLTYGSSIGTTGAVENLITHACKFVECGGRIVITGGEAQHFLKHIPVKMVYKPYLVLWGLGLTCEKLPKYT